jgi:tetratricopeptide (TPR) repeat protein
MNRTTKLKIIYIVVLMVLGGVSFWAIYATARNPLVIVGIVLVLMIPGRICGHYWREFFKGRNLMTQGRFTEAEPLFAAFLAKVQKKPWLKKLINFSWGMYTRDIEVMTLNNLGAMNIELGKFHEGKEFLYRAISIDVLAPLPYFNLALIAPSEGNKDLAEDLLHKCQERGYTGSTVDQLIRQAGELLARVEGRVKSEQVNDGNDV